MALIDLVKTSYGETILKQHEEDGTAIQMIYDKEMLDEAREELYDYLKRCIECYNELESCLAKLHRGKRRVRKRIYIREQMQDTQVSSKMIEHYFYTEEDSQEV